MSHTNGSEVSPLDSQSHGEDGVDAALSKSAAATTLMGKLFVVPAIVVCIMLGVAVVVVLFGTSSIDKPATIQELLVSIEADSGAREYGMLLPAAKEAWQAAQELAVRFDQKDKHFNSEDEIEDAANRVVAFLEKSKAGAPSVAVTDDEKRGLMRDHYLMLALARLGRPSTVSTFQALLKSPNADTRRVALQSLAEMGGVAAAKAAVQDVYPLLSDSDSAVRMVACLTVAALADRGDATAIRQVAALLEGDRETQWNAAVALARLGSGRGKLILLNMLDRGFWEKLDLDYVDDGRRVVRQLSSSEVDDRLRAAILSASKLGDAEVDAKLTELRDDDASIHVREAARVAIEEETKARMSQNQQSNAAQVALIDEGC